MRCVNGWVFWGSETEQTDYSGDCWRESGSIGDAMKKVVARGSVAAASVKLRLQLPRL